MKLKLIILTILSLNLPNLFLSTSGPKPKSYADNELVAAYKQIENRHIFPVYSFYDSGKIFCVNDYLNKSKFIGMAYLIRNYLDIKKEVDIRKKKDGPTKDNELEINKNHSHFTQKVIKNIKTDCKKKDGKPKNGLQHEYPNIFFFTSGLEDISEYSSNELKKILNHKTERIFFITINLKIK